MHRQICLLAEDPTSHKNEYGVMIGKKRDEEREETQPRAELEAGMRKKRHEDAKVEENSIILCVRLDGGLYMLSVDTILASHIRNSYFRNSVWVCRGVVAGFAVVRP